MTSTESTEPKGSDDSSTNPRCGCGHLRSSHFDYTKDTAYCIGNRNLCQCDGFQLPVEQIHKWKRCTHCSHREHSARCMEVPVPGTWSWTGRCGCLELTSAREIEAKCKGAGGCPEHPTVRQEAKCPPACTEAHTYSGSCVLRAEGPKGETENPPLTPEGEEEAGCAHESWDVTSEWYDHLSMKWHKSRRCNDCGEGLDVVFENEPHLPQNQGKGKRPKKPQPTRRPPYAVAYSVGDHAYEIALPGDATVVAQDGALIITHSLGPVAGIVQARPLEGEQS